MKTIFQAKIPDRNSFFIVGFGQNQQLKDRAELFIQIYYQSCAHVCGSEAIVLWRNQHVLLKRRQKDLFSPPET